MKRQELFSTGETARILGIKQYRITYAHVNGMVDEPNLRVAGKRVYEMADVRRLALHFGITIKKSQKEEIGEENV